MPIKRPLTPEELQQLQAEGYDMSSYRGEPIEIPDPPQTPQQTTAAGAFGRSALASAIPTAAGGAGFGLTMAALAPATGGTSLLAIPVAAGAAYLAGRGASALQQKVMPEEWKQSLATAQQEHPYAAGAGALATLPLGGFNPSRVGFKYLASGLPKAVGLAGGEGLVPLERAALINAAAGGTLGGVQEAVMQQMEGRPFDPASIALNAGIGATFTQPNRIGKAYGFHPLIEGPLDKTTQPGLNPLAKSLVAKTDAQGQAGIKESTDRQPVVEMPNYAAGPEQLLVTKPGTPEFIRAKKIADYEAMKKEKQQQDVAEKVPELKVALAEKQVKPAELPKPIVTETGKEIYPDYTGVKEHDAGEVAKESAADLETRKLEGLGDRYQPEGEGLLKTKKTEDFESTGNWKVLLPDGTYTHIFRDPDTMGGWRESDGKYNFSKKILGWNKKEALDYLSKNKGEFVRSQQPESTLSPLGAEVQAAMPANLKGWTPEFQAIVQPVLEQHGIKVQPDLTLEAKGQAKKLSNGEVWNIINPGKATPDTLAHEGWHGLQFLLEDAAAGGNRKAAELSAKLSKASEQGLKHYNELRALAGKEPVDMTEFTAMEQGYEFVKRQLNLDKETGWEKWKNDFSALFKSKWSENATVEDLRRAVNFRMVNQPRLGMGKVTAGGAATTRQQPKEVKQQPEGEGLRTSIGIGNFHPFEGTFDRVTREISPQLGGAFHRWYARMENYLGMGQVALKDLGKFDRNTINAVEQKMNNTYRTGTHDVTFTPEEQPIFDIISKYYTDIRQAQNAAGLKIEGREAGENPFYVPHQLNDQALDLFTNRPTSVEARAAYNEWVEHAVEHNADAHRAGNTDLIPREEIAKNITHYIEALGSPSRHYTSVDFGALRKAAGYGLPDSLRETDAIRNLNKYSHRAARDLAMYQELESKPEIASRLKLRNPNTGEWPQGTEHTGIGVSQHPSVQSAMKWVTGNWSGTVTKSSQQLNALARLVHSGILGPATAARNVAQIPVNMVPYIDSFKDLGAMWRGVTEMRTHANDALRHAAVKPQVDKLMFSELESAPDRLTAFMQKAATFARKWQGSELIENTSRELTFSIGKELARSKVIALRSGDTTASRFLDKFGLLVDGDVRTMEGPALEEALNQMAKNFTDRNQGTYSGAGLPSWTQESKFAPFFALQKWSIEKSNVIKQDVINPFMTGENRLPMLTYTLGTFLTGAAIQKLNELITKRKGQDPTWQEALDTPSVKAIIGEMTTLMQLSSYAGIISDGLKLITDVGLEGKTPRNIVSFPTATSALAFEEKTKWMLEALSQGENPWDVFKNYATDLIVQQVQFARMVANHTIREQDVERSDKFRDMRTWNELQGKPQGNITKTNPYLGLDAKEYKRSGDIGEAVKILPGVLQRIQQRNGGNYEKLQRGMASVSGNSYQTFPSMENMPMAFQNYYQFLARTQGKKAADARLQDYMRQRMVNQVKSGLVPRL